MKIRKIDKKNRRGSIGQTATWIVATVIIFFIIVVFFFVTTSLGSLRKLNFDNRVSFDIFEKYSGNEVDIALEKTATTFNIYWSDYYAGALSEDKMKSEFRNTLKALRYDVDDVKFNVKGGRIVVNEQG